MTSQSRDAVTTPGGTVVDRQLFVNHVGTFFLTSLLLPKVIAAGKNAPKGATRIVNVASHGHRLSPIRFSDYAIQKGAFDVPDAEKPPAGAPEMWFKVDDEGYPGFIGYGQSKGANILHVVELNARLGKTGANVLAVPVHPGTISTELSRSLNPEGKKAIDGTAPGGVFKTLDQGAATTIVGAFDPKLSEAQVEGPLYLADCQYNKERLAPHASDPAIAGRLWVETEKMLGVSCL